MKTAISIPDPLFKAADKMAKHLGVSRSELYSEAIEAFIEIHSKGSITEQINKVYAHENSAVDPVLYALQIKNLSQEEW